MGVNIEKSRFFCFNFKESRVVQRMALFLVLARERLLAVIVMDHQGMWRGRPLTENTTFGRDGDGDGGGEWRWGDGSWDTTLAALKGTYFIRN